MFCQMLQHTLSMSVRLLKVVGIALWIPCLTLCSVLHLTHLVSVRLQTHACIALWVPYPMHYVRCTSDTLMLGLLNRLVPYLMHNEHLRCIYNTTILLVSMVFFVMGFFSKFYRISWDYVELCFTSVHHCSTLDLPRSSYPFMSPL
jgi:hypothetical protein